MKKRMLAILLSALLVANINSCNFDSKGDMDELFENIETTESNSKETDEKTAESETNAEIKPMRKSPDFYNGVWGNSNVAYAFNQNSEFTVHIADWDEDHLVTSLSDKDMNAVNFSIRLLA